MRNRGGCAWCRRRTGGRLVLPAARPEAEVQRRARQRQRGLRPRQLVDLRRWLDRPEPGWRRGRPDPRRHRSAVVDLRRKPSCDPEGPPSAGLPLVGDGGPSDARATSGWKGQSWSRGRRTAPRHPAPAAGCDIGTLSRPLASSCSRKLCRLCSRRALSDTRSRRLIRLYRATAGGSLNSGSDSWSVGRWFGSLPAMASRARCAREVIGLSLSGMYGRAGGSVRGWFRCPSVSRVAVSAVAA